MGYYKQFWQPKQEEPEVELAIFEPFDREAALQEQEWRRAAEEKRQQRDRRLWGIELLAREEKRQVRLRRQSEARILKRLRVSCVYFISDAPGNLVKIGFTKRLTERSFELKVIANQFTLLGTIEAIPKEEKVIHKMFYQFRQPNNPYPHPTEWYYLSKPIQFFIKHFCTTLSHGKEQPNETH